MTMTNRDHAEKACSNSLIETPLIQVSHWSSGVKTEQLDITVGAPTEFMNKTQGSAQAIPKVVWHQQQLSRSTCVTTGPGDCLFSEQAEGQIFGSSFQIVMSMNATIKYTTAQIFSYALTHLAHSRA
ncbi:hypothetical protein LSAT2_011334 [Lamellibrachia satsuma]|nr:hypothetical protein LSAT2_011334 [Lamellibrachia satsuma]